MLLSLLPAFSLLVSADAISIPLRFMTYNVMRGRYSCFENQLRANSDFTRGRILRTEGDFVRANLFAMSQLIRQYDPDVIAIQEVQESNTIIPMNGDQVSTSTHLAQLLDMTRVFSPTLYDEEVRMDYGTAMLINRQRLSLLSVEIVALPTGIEARNSPCLFLRTKLTNVTFYTCGIHLDHNIASDAVRLQQSQTILEWAKRRSVSCPIALLGDFNGNSMSRVITVLSELFNDRAVKQRPTWGKCREELKDKIDHILLDNRISWIIRQFVHGSEMNAGGIEVKMLSDHVPLFADTILNIDPLC